MLRSHLLGLLVCREKLAREFPFLMKVCCTLSRRFCAQFDTITPKLKDSIIGSLSIKVQHEV